MAIPRTLTKRELRDALGFRLDKDLAGFFNLGKAAISRWPEDEPIPEGRQWEARAKHPGLIPEPPKKLAA